MSGNRRYYHDLIIAAADLYYLASDDENITGRREKRRLAEELEQLAMEMQDGPNEPVSADYNLLMAAAGLNYLATDEPEGESRARKRNLARDLERLVENLPIAAASGIRYLNG